MAKRILFEKQKEAPQDVYQYSFFHQEVNFAAIGSVFSVGDGYVQIIDCPSPLLLKTMKFNPGLSVYHIARKQQCRSFNEVWVNTVSTGQGCRISPLKYKRRNRGPYPALSRYYDLTL